MGRLVFSILFFLVESSLRYELFNCFGLWVASDSPRHLTNSAAVCVEMVVDSNSDSRLKSDFYWFMRCIIDNSDYTTSEQSVTTSFIATKSRQATTKDKDKADNAEKWEQKIRVKEWEAREREKTKWIKQTVDIELVTINETRQPSNKIQRKHSKEQAKDVKSKHCKVIWKKSSKSKISHIFEVNRARIILPERIWWNRTKWRFCFLSIESCVCVYCVRIKLQRTGNQIIWIRTVVNSCQAVCNFLTVIIHDSTTTPQINTFGCVVCACFTICVEYHTSDNTNIFEREWIQDGKKSVVENNTRSTGLTLSELEPLTTRETL